METLYQALTFVIVILVGYLIGSIPTSVIVAKAHGIDITSVGSHNAGGTNVGRVIGKKAGLLTMLIDILKTYFFCSMVMLFLSFGPAIFVNPTPRFLNETKELLVGLAGFSVAIGHTFPLFNRFKGGKAVACFAGYVLFAAPLISLVGVIVFFLIFKFGKRVSLSSVIGVPSCFLASLIPMSLDFTLLQDVSLYNGGLWFGHSYYLHLTFITTIILFLFSLLVVIRHYSNIARLAKGKEPETHFKKD